jgi:hypothetical protein
MGVRHRERLRRAIMDLATLALPALMLIGLATAARGNPIVTNGSFETFTAGGATGSCSSSTQTLTDSNASPWNTTSGYAFVLNSSNYSSFCGVDGSLGLYGPITASPDGGNYLAQDGGYLTGFTSQALSGLVIGDAYIVTFYMAAAQQTGYSGATTDYWTVGLGTAAGSGPSQNTGTINLASGTFSGWVGEEMSFFAAAASEVLWFFAVGSPAGQPPFALLDGVVVTVPEPSAFAMLIPGLLLLLGVRRRYRRVAAMAGMPAA